MKPFQCHNRMNREILSKIFLVLFGTSNGLLQPTGNQRYLECAMKCALTSVHNRGHGAAGALGKGQRCQTPGKMFRRRLTTKQSLEVSVHCSRDKGISVEKVSIILTATAQIFQLFLLHLLDGFGFFPRSHHYQRCTRTYMTLSR